MAHVRLDGVNVQIPVYDAHAQRLLRLPAFGRAKVGTNTASYAAGVMYMHVLKN
jgi:hypothetical protein